jgi:cobalamin biosynthesis protein CobC
LIEAAARRYRVRHPATIVAAPGTQALIQLLPRLIPKSRVAVLGPTYEEHEICWERCGHDVTVVADLRQAAEEDVVVVVNPDNPTGRLLAAAQLRALDALMIVDEAFIDFHPRTASLASELPPRAVVLRSFGKSYGLAGVRLGFAIAEKSLAEQMRHELGPWAVSGPAIEIGRIALADDSWLEAMVQRLAKSAERLDEVLIGTGFEIVGGTSLFRLARHPAAPQVVEALGRRGIHVRAFAHEPSWLRFGLPADEEFGRLADALAQFSRAEWSATGGA